MKPVCALCKKAIGFNEHYFVMKNRTVCKKCGAKLEHKVKNMGVFLNAGTNKKRG